MDFILFYSKYSNNCAIVLQEVPLLNEKAICVDSAGCRALLSQLPYQVQRVPTLFIVDGVDKILKVIEGVNDIRNWFILTTYSMSSPSDVVETQPSRREIVEDEVVDDLMPQSGGTNISQIDDIADESGEDYVLKTTKTVGVKNLAEELQRQRESFIENTEMPRGQIGARPK